MSAGNLFPALNMNPSVEVVYMAKNPNNKTKKPVKRDEPMTSAMKFFLAGCIAELYLLLIRRFYINGTAEQQIAWYDVYLTRLIWGGAAVLAVGLILSYLWRESKKNRVIGWSVSGLGLFFSVSAGLVLWNMSVLALLTVVVPVVMLLGVLWSLYDRECALSLTVLGLSLVVLWVCRRQLASIYYGTAVKAVVVIAIVLLAVLAFLVKQGKLGKLLPAQADSLPVYVACGLSAVALAVALVSSVIAYYATWVLAVVVFGLAVYYTVKQL